jgi:hypothetical protein
MLWWIPGRQSASPSHVEFAHAPQQKKYAQAKRHCCKRYVPHGEVCRDPNRDGQRKGDYAWQSDKCGDGSDEHQTATRGCVADERAPESIAFHARVSLCSSRAVRAMKPSRLAAM